MLLVVLLLSSHLVLLLCTLRHSTLFWLFWLNQVSLFVFFNLTVQLLSSCFPLIVFSHRTTRLCMTIRITTIAEKFIKFQHASTNTGTLSALIQSQLFIQYKYTQKRSIHRTYLRERVSERMNERKKILEEEKADAQTKEKKRDEGKKTNEGKKNGMKTRKKRRVPSDLPWRMEKTFFATVTVF